MKKPNPGSDAAREAGCICPVIDNLRGVTPPYGYKDGVALWIYTPGCPVAHSEEDDDGA